MAVLLWSTTALADCGATTAALASLTHRLASISDPDQRTPLIRAIRSGRAAGRVLGCANLPGSELPPAPGLDAMAATLAQQVTSLEASVAALGRVVLPSTASSERQSLPTPDDTTDCRATTPASPPYRAP